MTTLAQIQADIQSLMEQMADIDIEEQSDLEPLLEELKTMMEKKVDGYLHMIRTFEAKAEIQRKEAERILKLASESQGKADWLKKTLKTHMEHTQTKRLEGNYGKASLCKNGGKSPIWLNPEIQPEDLPSSLTYISTYVDNKAIRQLTEDNDGTLEINGIIVAKLLERGSHLRLR